jgi:NAD(P)-dependent dehydrogenase (short-subunit alcohol dehydrogenase family)
MSDRKTVLVTGANKGIGLEIARQLASQGHRVIIGARNASAGEAAAKEIAGSEFLHLDISSAASIQSAAEELKGRVGVLHVLVNNAAILLDDNAGVLNLPADTLRQTLETNLIGTLCVTQALMALLGASAEPRVINFSSTAGQLAGGLLNWAPAYSISKTALNALTQHLAAALPKFAVNCLSPGWVRTDMGGGAAPLTVTEGADTAVWLATEAPQTLTGKFLREREVIDW